MAARGVVRQTGARDGARTRGNAGRMAEGGTAGVAHTGDDPRARDARAGLHRIVAGMREGGRPRPALLLGGAIGLGLAVLAVRFFTGSRPARHPGATPTPAVAPADTGGARAPASPLAARTLDAPDASAPTSDAGVGGATADASDAPPVAPAHDEAAPIRVTGSDGHVPPVVVSVEPPPPHHGLRRRPAVLQYNAVPNEGQVKEKRTAAAWKRASRTRCAPCGGDLPRPATRWGKSPPQGAPPASRHASCVISR